MKNPWNDLKAFQFPAISQDYKLQNANLNIHRYNNNNNNFKSDNNQRLTLRKFDNNRYGNDNVSNNNNNLSGNLDISISYKNYDIDEVNRNKMKKSYGNELLTQMRENELKREEEKIRKKLLEMEDELRISKEIEMMDKRKQQEENLKLLNLNKTNNLNIELFKEKSKKEKRKIEILENPENNFKVKANLLLENNNKIENDFQNESNAILALFNKELEKRRKETDYFKLNVVGNLEKIKIKILDQNKEFLKKIHEIREQNLHANLYKIDTLKELKEIKEEIKQKQFQDNFTKDCLYKSLVETNTLNKEMFSLKDSFFKSFNKSLNILNLKNVPCFPLNRYSLDNLKLNLQFKEDEFNLNELLISNKERIKKLNKFDL